MYYEVISVMEDVIMYFYILCMFRWALISEMPRDLPTVYAKKKIV